MPLLIFGFLDLISSSLLLTPPRHPESKRKCDENNNSNSASADAEKPSNRNDDGDGDDDDDVAIAADDESDEKSEKIKPKQMVGLFPLDLRSELKKRVGGGKVGFALKKSSTNIDVLKDDRKISDPITIANKPSDLLRSIRERELKVSQVKKDDSDDDDGVENLSFKEKLQLIERSSSKNLVNPL